MLMLLLQPCQSLFPCWGIFVPERAGAETVTDVKLHWQKLLENVFHFLWDQKFANT